MKLRCWRNIVTGFPKVVIGRLSCTFHRRHRHECSWKWQLAAKGDNNIWHASLVLELIWFALFFKWTKIP